MNHEGESVRYWTLITLLLLTGCPTEEDPPVEPDPIKVSQQEGCENLNPLYCAFPYPSDRYMVEDPSTTTGYGAAIEAGAMPESIDPEEFDLSPYNRLDGMSPATQIMTLFEKPPMVTGDHIAGAYTIERYLDDDHPTVILDLDSGERVAHWVELDARAQYAGETVIYLRLASRLEEDRSYAVAMRGLVDDGGDLLEPSLAFATIRDGLHTDAPDIEDRWDTYQAMFDTLEANGIPRADLQTAWRFHTASGDAIRGDILHARADALERLGDSGIGCTVTSVDEAYGDDGITLRRVRGTYTVPSYMDSPEPPARYQRGDDGLPVFVEDVEVPFTAIVPTSLTEGTAHAGPLITFGHGLMLNGEAVVSSEPLRRNAYEMAGTIVATDWAGMSSNDTTTVAGALTDPGTFVYVTERLQQGMINQIALTRTFMGICRDIPELQHDDVELVDPQESYYIGGSQGGIYGGTLLALSPDIERGVLLVNGANYPFMIERSIDFESYFPLFELAFPERLDQALMLPMAQHLWDGSDPSSYLPFLQEGLPGIGPKQVMAITVTNDAQVPNLSSDMAMRMAGAPVVQGSVSEPWGFEVRVAPYTGSGYVEIDMGDPDCPEGNLAPPVDMGGHGAIARDPMALLMIEAFLYDGEVIMPCDGECDPD